MTEVTNLSVTCEFLGLTACELGSPEYGGVEWAARKLVSLGFVKRRTKLKRLSARTISAVVQRLSEAEEWRDNHECESYYGEDY